MMTFVFVHGLGLGGWCWKHLADKLRKHNHNVFTPTLTGVGERSHLATPDVNLDTHITDIVNVMKWENLNDVILVGHSYGGSVVTGVADREAQRVKILVYLDAFVPHDGESVMGLQSPDRVEYYYNLVEKLGKGWLLPPNPPEFYGITDPHEIRWIKQLSSPQPLATFTQPISLIYKNKPPFPRAYIWASSFAPSPFVRFADRYRHDPEWAYREIDAGHMIMLSHTKELIQVLEELDAVTREYGRVE